MRDYSKISPNLWQSSRFNSLPSDDERYLYLYLLTCTHQNSAGIYHLPDGYACSDLQWPADRYAKARAQLVEADLIQFDDNASVVLISRWFKHNPPTSEDHLTGILRFIDRLPNTELVNQAATAADEAWSGVQAEKAERRARQKPKAVTELPANSDGNSRLLNTPYMKRSAGG